MKSYTERNPEAYDKWLVSQDAIKAERDELAAELAHKHRQFIEECAEGDRLEAERDALAANSIAHAWRADAAEARVAALEAKLADAKDDYQRWHKAFLDAKYPEVLPTRLDLERRVQALEAALENIRARCEWVAMKSGDLVYINSVASAALKPTGTHSEPARAKQ